MSTLEFVLPEGSNDPCPNACGGLTEDPYGGPCKTCWAKVTRQSRRWYGSDDDELPADEHHCDVSCDDRPYCTITEHHAMEDMR